MYKLTLIFYGDIRHECLFKDLHSAEEFRDLFVNGVFNVLDHRDYDVIVQEIKCYGKFKD